MEQQRGQPWIARPFIARAAFGRRTGRAAREFQRGTAIELLVVRDMGRAQGRIARPPRCREGGHRLGLDRVDRQIGGLVEAAKAGGGVEADFDAPRAANRDPVARHGDAPPVVRHLRDGGEHHAAPGCLVIADWIGDRMIVGRGIGRRLAVQDQPVALRPRRSAQQRRQRQVGVDRPALRGQPDHDQLRGMRHENLAAVAGRPHGVGDAGHRLVEIEFAAIVAHRAIARQRDHQVADRRIAVGKGALQVLRPLIGGVIIARQRSLPHACQFALGIRFGVGDGIARPQTVFVQ